MFEHRKEINKILKQLIVSYLHLPITCPYNNQTKYSSISNILIKSWISYQFFYLNHILFKEKPWIFFFYFQFSIRSPADSALENLVRCAICSRRLNVPKMLNCQHTFCLTCLETELSNSPDKCNTIVCPTCSAKMVLPFGIILSELPNNLYINSLIQVLKDQVRKINMQKPYHML